ncbi:MAG TPA: HAMP domain-containing sensor histidine kinase, partial [Bacteroidales bacterium]|nr:HAMP domain-containing sensor histidine kinase [Bacteroidales bacterium]
INEKKGLALSDTGIYEFNTLNKVLNNMSEKILTDYSNMKEFTENASHEIQTPLAIIKSKIEILVQSGKLDEEQMDALQTINDAVYRLAKLNSGLILISKIDNRQFHDNGEVDLITVIDRILDDFEDLIAMKDLHVEKSLSESYKVNLNPELAEILVSNLVSNAIKHNVAGGFIKIIQTGDSLLIWNSGLPLSVPEEELFKRFVKNNSNSKSLGLGLAIIKKICDQYSVTCNYTCIDSEHVFQLDFQTYCKE